LSVVGHRYLVGPGDRAGNTVLPIYGSDVIVYGANLPAYLVHEMGISWPDDPAEDLEMAPIPFWQDVIDRPV
jgi:hypothetical protein